MSHESERGLSSCDQKQRSYVTQKHSSVKELRERERSHLLEHIKLEI